MTSTVSQREIRLLGSADLGALLELYGHLHQRDEAPPETDVIEAAWEEFLQSRHCLCFGGHEDGILVSSCVLTIVPNLTRGCRPYGLIENVVTHRAHRNKGWGKAVLSHALSAGWAQNCYKIMLMTGRKDEAIGRFYEAAGFDGQEKQAYVARPSGA